MKQLIKNILRNLPPFKQFLGRMHNLEQRLRLDLTKAQREILSLKRTVEKQNKEIELLQKNLKNLSDRVSRINDNMNLKIDAAKNEANYLYYKGLHPDNYKAALTDWYYQRTWQHIDVDNPQTFNEKIQWLKLYDSTPLKTKLADKYLVREWVADTIGENYLIPLLGVWDYFDQIDFNLLPDQFVLKTNHSSGWNMVVKDKKTFDFRQARNKFNTWMKKNFAFQFGLELHYANIPRKIIAEQYMAELDGDIYDYRFFCFNGQPQYVWVDIGSGTTHHKRNIYDLKWTLQTYGVNYPPIIPEPEKPGKFDEMVELAKKLCTDFIFVRVDFYCVDNNIYFGEMTFTPQSGAGVWEDESQNYHYGDLMKLPEKDVHNEKD